MSPPLSGSGWRPSATARSWALAGMGLVLLGLLVGRVDVAALGVPLVLGLVWDRFRRPADEGDVTVEEVQHDPAAARIRAAVVLRPAPGTSACLVRIDAPGHRSLALALAADRPRNIPVSVAGTRTGRRTVYSFVHRSTGPDHVVTTPYRMVGPVVRTVLPRPEPLGRLPLPPRLQGLTGGHVSRRVGEGGDLHDVAVFAPGDRLRRIDWRVTLREAGRGSLPGTPTELYVRRTFATADAVVVLVLDARDEVGPDVASWAGERPIHPDDATSLDIARGAAASVANAYLATGDRVGLVDLGGNRHPIRPAAGRRHLLRIVHALAAATPSGPAGPVQRAPQIPSGALVVLFSTFLDDHAARIAGAWRRHGHRVLAIDVLPPPVAGHLTPAAHNAYRLVRLEREDRLRELAHTGVETVAWAADTQRSPAGELAGLARRRHRR